ncbi:MAG: hypothetical protein LBC51_03385 [Treponema sp.]|nr:hypothetical protein [Treponema sp.]
MQSDSSLASLAGYITQVLNGEAAMKEHTYNGKTLVGIATPVWIPTGC